MRKKLIIGIVAGVAVVGGIVTAIICHKRKRDAFRELDLYDLRELEEGTYGE